MFTFSVALSCRQCGPCINPMCLCSPTQRGGLLPTVELSSFNIQTFLIPWRDGFWVLERKLNNDSLYWQTRANRYHMSQKVFLETFTWMVSLHSNVVRTGIASNYIHTDYIVALNMQLLFALKQGPPLVLFAPPPPPPLVPLPSPHVGRSSSPPLQSFLGRGEKMGLFWGGASEASGGVDVVNPCFTPAAQYGRVTVQPVANLIYLRCSSFLHHSLPLNWTYTGCTVTVFL